MTRKILVLSREVRCLLCLLGIIVGTSGLLAINSALEQPGDQTGLLVVGLLLIMVHMVMVIGSGVFSLDEEKET